MKRLFSCTLLAGLMMTGSALAQDTGTATIRFVGTIGAITCSLQTANLTIPLGAVSKTTFGGIGSASPWVGGNLVSSGCNANLVSMTFSGTADPNNLNMFAVTGGATGVAVQLDQAGGTQQAVPNSSTPMTFAPAAAGGLYPFAARYVQTATTVTTGTANATITVLITYT
ncbi:fimbrial protein [Dyella humi]|uniref:Type 1 fimbrial protein n=1 Tax=Dyella humi TaxID=1770547 RepID=A0ABW8IH39_9GAMM